MIVWRAAVTVVEFARQRSLNVLVSDREKGKWRTWVFRGTLILEPVQTVRSRRDQNFSLNTTERRCRIETGME